MWALTNHTRYAAERTCVIDLDGARRWVVVVKATYDLAPDGRPTLAKEQRPPLVAPEFSGEDGASSLRYDLDLCPDKPGTDVIVNGSAHAPGGRPTDRVEITLRVGDRRKSLTVVGDRPFVATALGDVVPAPAQPFMTMPVVFERAYGGHDRTDPDPARQKLFAENPVGTGHVVDRASLLGKVAPNIEAEGGTVPGLGPIACSWQPRARLAGTYDGAWFETRRPLLPRDFDPRHHMCAPQDQQFIPHLAGDVHVALTNMTPNGLLAVPLPKVYFAFETKFVTGPPMQHRAKLHTVILEPDVASLMMVWHTSLACHHRYDDLETTVIRELPYI